jgi:chromosome segregation ATPase
MGINRLHDKMERLQQRINEVQDAMANLRTADSYTLKEKAEKFDMLHRLASTLLREKVELGRDKDAKHWCFEEVMKLLGDTVLDVWNNVDW